jgi:hypothetical protein
MNEELYRQLQASTRSQENLWPSSPILVNLCSDPDDDSTLEQIDLCNLIMGTPSDTRRRAVRTRENLLLDAHYVPRSVYAADPTRPMDGIRSWLFQAVQPGGATLVTGSKKNIVDTIIQSTIFRCARGCCFGGSPVVRNGIKTGRRRRRPVKEFGENPCGFWFSILYDAVSDRYFFPRAGVAYGNHFHSGHRRILPAHILFPANVLNKEELTLIMQQCSLNISPKAIQTLHQKRNDKFVSVDTIRTLKIKHSATHLVLQGRKSSAAEKLVADLESRPNIRYVILTAERNMEGLITIRNSRKSNLPEQESFMGHDSEVTQTAKVILDSLRIDSGTKLLLCAMWATDKGIEYFTKFPSVFGLDVTNGTNEEKRPLGRATGKNMLRNNIPWLNCFLPSESQWVWGWFFNEALPQILSQHVLHSVRLIITDGDDKCYSQVDAAISAGIFPNARHRLCAWHKINRNYLKNAEKLVPKDAILESKFISAAARWMKYFTTSVESESEGKKIIVMFHHWLKRFEGRIYLPLLTHAQEFFLRSFLPNLWRLCHRHYHACPGGMHHTTQMCESENSRIKSSPIGTCPQHPIHIAHNAIIQVETNALDSLEGAAFRAMDGSTGYELPFQGTLSLHLNKLAVTVLGAQWAASINYCHMRIPLSSHIDEVS